MDGLGYRGSLARAQSGFTSEQLAERQSAYETRLFRQHGKIVISESDCGDNVIVQGWFKNLVTQRFG